MKAGRFREDLFYRLHVFPITVPPLRERPADIPALARHFLARFAAEEGKRIRVVTPEALRVLTAFRWPGNIRQLENAVFRAVVLAEADSVGLDEFPQIAAQVGMTAGSAGRTGRRRPRAPSMAPADDFAPRPRCPIAWRRRPIRRPSPCRRCPATRCRCSMPRARCGRWTRSKSELIRYAMTHYRGQMSEVARRLQIGRSTLYRKLEALGLNSERAEVDS